MQPDAALPKRKKTPVSVITGFLGSGKTTLLNHILTEHHGLRIAVIENEFGEVGVDDALLKTPRKGQAQALSGPAAATAHATEEQIIEMNNGCICCTVRGDLIKILGRLATRDLDLVLIETTGLADPAPVAQTFFVDEEIAASYALDAIITLVDAKHALQHLREVKPEGVENESVEQVAFADIILLNKVDLVSEAELAATEAAIRAINGGARILRTLQSRVDPARILGQGAFDLQRVMAMDPEFLSEGEHQHDQSVTSVGFAFEGDLELAKLETLIGALIREQGTDLYRYKGVLAVKGKAEKFVFQGVHMLFGGQFADPWAPGEVRGCKFIFIGKNLDRTDITEAFLACKAAPLRFAVGARVQVNLDEGFRSGIVLKQWDDGNAYRVAVAGDGRNVWAPMDVDAYIRAADC
jgi:G3E family GTPase